MNLAFLLLLLMAYWLSPSKRAKDTAFAYAGALSLYLLAFPYHEGYPLTLAFDLAILSYLLSRRGELTLFLSVMCSGGAVLTILDAFRVYGIEYHSPTISAIYEAMYTVIYISQIIAIFTVSAMARYHLIKRNNDKLRNPWFIRASI